MTQVTTGGSTGADTRVHRTPTMLEMPPRRAAVIAGLGYLAIFVLAVFANFFVLTGLVESGDATATAANVRESLGLFRAGFVSFLLVFVIDVVIAWALWIVFRSVSRDLSLVTAWFRLVYTVFLGVALVPWFRALELLSGESFLAAFEPAQIDAQVMLALDSFNHAWLIGLACFGVHLVILGALIRRSTGVPRVLGLVLMVAGAAYVADTVAQAVLADYEGVENLFLAIVAVPSVVGELWLGLWLLLKGGKEPLVPRS